MELRTLEYFLAVAREENMTRASAILHITQPTLSRQIKHLEEELGVALFERTANHLSLTPEGTLLRRRAAEMLELANKTVSEVTGRDEMNGTISISAGELRSFDLLAKCMVRFLQLYPDVDFDVISASAPDIVEKIERGLADFGLITGQIDLSRLEFIDAPVKEQMGILVRDDDPLATRKEITPEDLRGVDLIMSKRGYFHDRVVEWLHEEPHIIMTYNLSNNAADLVKEAKCACLCMDLNAHYDHLKFIPLKGFEPQSSVFAWKKNVVLSPLLKTFLKFVKEEMTEREGSYE